MILYHKEAVAIERGKTSLKSLKDVKIYVIETSAASKQVANAEEKITIAIPKPIAGTSTTMILEKIVKPTKVAAPKLFVNNIKELAKVAALKSTMMTRMPDLK